MIGWSAFGSNKGAVKVGDWTQVWRGFYRCSTKKWCRHCIMVMCSGMIWWSFGGCYPTWWWIVSLRIAFNIFQVNLQSILLLQPVPLSQGVLLSLLQQLACDINNDTPRKLAWMTDVATAINPSNQMIAMHVRPIFEQVYQILHHQHSLPTLSSVEQHSLRLLMHVINSMMMACKWSTLSTVLPLCKKLMYGHYVQIFFLSPLPNCVESVELDR